MIVGLHVAFSGVVQPDLPELVALLTVMKAARLRSPSASQRLVASVLRKEKLAYIMRHVV
jgi:hypothetical protein